MKTTKEGQSIVFEIKDENYAVPLIYVKEIIRVPEITELPMSEESLKGIINLRGIIVPVISIREKFGIEKSIENKEQERIVILEKEGTQFGVTVDKMRGVINVNENEIEENDGNFESEFIKNVIKKDKEIYMELNLEKLIEIKTFGNSANGNLGNSNKSTENRQNILEVREKFVTFKIGENDYGFNIEDVKEIIRYIKPREVPAESEYMLGVIKLREEILPISDLRIKLGAEKTEVDEFTKVVVIESKNHKIGYVVDRIEEVINIEKDKILPPPLYLKTQGNDEIKSIIKDKNENITIILDIEKLMADVSENLDKLSETKNSIKENESNIKKDEDVQFIIFELEKTLYGIEIEDVREINRLSNITKIPKAPEFVEGIINLRGDVIAVVDLRKRFSLNKKEIGEFTRIIISEVKGVSIGFIVDYVKYVSKVNRNEILPVETLGFVNNDFLKGVYKNKDNNSMVLILNFENVMTEKEVKDLGKIGSKPVTKKRETKKKVPKKKKTLKINE
ncbi:chemotaxis protein CheW [Haliovirga abyssi]|uniref:Chemotaxis protein CheW n=1 Tax=Haliovirga abyssi TaxID=2996794 RepID=A0AAU9D7U2_9FUSO|nr:chemotaxis protein CheW [Haliovirga abyssi]BDU49641.1 chemotaxis protein CheW [Haliovirga abyssi]